MKLLYYFGIVIALFLIPSNVYAQEEGILFETGIIIPIIVLFVVIGFALYTAITSSPRRWCEYTATRGSRMFGLAPGDKICVLCIYSHPIRGDCNAEITRTGTTRFGTISVFNQKGTGTITVSWPITPTIRSCAPCSGAKAYLNFV